MYGFTSVYPLITLIFLVLWGVVHGIRIHRKINGPLIRKNTKKSGKTEKEL